MPATYIIMTAVVAVTLVGDYWLKRAALGGGIPTTAFVAGSVMYVVSAFGLVIAMRHMTLAAVGVWYSVLTILAMTGLGVLVFGERLIARDLVGIGLAFAALACMTRPG